MSKGTPDARHDASHVMGSSDDVDLDSAEDIPYIYNSETLEASEEFQSQDLLRVDGLSDPITLEATEIDLGFRGAALEGDISIAGDAVAGSSVVFGNVSDSDSGGLPGRDGSEPCALTDPEFPGDTTTDPR